MAKGMRPAAGKGKAVKAGKGKKSPMMPAKKAAPMAAFAQALQGAPQGMPQQPLGPAFGP